MSISDPRFSSGSKASLSSLVSTVFFQRLVRSNRFRVRLRETIILLLAKPIVLISGIGRGPVGLGVRGRMYLQPQKMGEKDYGLGGYPAIPLRSYKLFRSCFSRRSKWISQAIKICTITISDYCRTIRYQSVIDNDQENRYRDTHR